MFFCERIQQDCKNLKQNIFIEDNEYFVVKVKFNSEELENFQKEKENILTSIFSFDFEKEYSFSYVYENKNYLFFCGKNNTQKILKGYKISGIFHYFFIKYHVYIYTFSIKEIINFLQLIYFKK